MRPRLAARFMCAPRRAVHSVAAWLHLVGASNDEDAAEHLERTGPRELLLEAMPEAPPWLYRTLDRAGDVALGIAFYARLSRIASSPNASALRLTTGRLNGLLLDHLDALAEMDPVVSMLPVALSGDERIAQMVATLAAFLRHTGVDPACALRDLPSSVGAAGVLRRLTKALHALPAPGLVCPAPPLSWAPMRSVGQLAALGRRHGFCVAKATNGGAEHWLRLTQGQSIYFFDMEGAVLLEVQQVAPGLWWIAEAAMSGGRRLMASETRSHRRMLTTAGWHVVEANPASALVSLACYADRDGMSLMDSLHALDDGWA